MVGTSRRAHARLVDRHGGGGMRHGLGHLLAEPPVPEKDAALGREEARLDHLEEQVGRQVDLDHCDGRGSLLAKTA